MPEIVHALFFDKFVHAIIGSSVSGSAQEADSGLPKVTVELTVKPLKTGEKAGIAENKRNDAKRLKRPDKGVG
jgi:hypothetical protein